MSLFGYYSLGLRSMSAAQLGLQVAGDNISNMGTPGYVRRRVELTPGFPVRVEGGLLDQGVNVARIGRAQDRLVQAALERERGTLGFAQERLRGLEDLETIFGPLDGDGIYTAYAAYSEAFSELAGRPEDLTLRANAIAAAKSLAGRIRGTYDSIVAQRATENDAVDAAVGRINTLARELAQLNLEIAAEEGGGTVAAPLRDLREQVIEELASLTGGSAAPEARGMISFNLSGGSTLVTDGVALPLDTTRDVQGNVRVLAGGDGRDITDRLRRGELGGLLSVRDDAIGSRLAGLDTLAQDLIDRTNALTTGATDLNGNPGGPLFTQGPGSPAATIDVDAALAADPRLLAISALGTPGDGDVANQIAALRETASAALGAQSPAAFLSQQLTALGNDVVQTDVARDVSNGLMQSLEARKAATSGVSLDEEAVDLIRFQRAYEAGARFIQVLNEITEITVNLI